MFHIRLNQKLTIDFHVRLENSRSTLRYSILETMFHIDEYLIYQTEFSNLL